jgi:hypothetical protein
VSDQRSANRNLPPFYCPYCGDDQIRPAGQHADGWACELCRRSWRLEYLGGVAPAGSGAGTGAGR